MQTVKEVEEDEGKERRQRRKSSIHFVISIFKLSFREVLCIKPDVVPFVVW